MLKFLALMELYVTKNCKKIVIALVLSLCINALLVAGLVGTNRARRARDVAFDAAIARLSESQIQRFDVELRSIGVGLHGIAEDVRNTNSELSAAIEDYAKRIADLENSQHRPNSGDLLGSGR